MPAPTPPFDPNQIVGPGDGSTAIHRSASRISQWRRQGLLVPVVTTAGRNLYRLGDLLRVRDEQQARMSPKFRARPS